MDSEPEGQRDARRPRRAGGGCHRHKQADNEKRFVTKQETQMIELDTIYSKDFSEWMTDRIL